MFIKEKSRSCGGAQIERGAENQSGKGYDLFNEGNNIKYLVILQCNDALTETLVLEEWYTPEQYFVADESGKNVSYFAFLFSKADAKIVREYAIELGVSVPAQIQYIERFGE